MQRKVGIRLRHLQQVPSDPRSVQQTYNNQSNNVRKKQRSPSPLNRRKIFPQPPPMQTTTTKPSRPQLVKKQSSQQQKYPSPIVNYNLNSHNVSINSTNQYESEVERLIESLRKKSLELQRKDQLIVKQKQQIDLLKAEIRNFHQQIKTLKAELEYQKKSKSQISYNSYNDASTKSAKNFYQSQSQTSKCLNEPYQQFKSEQNYNFSKSPYTQNNKLYDERKIKRSRIDDREQQSISSDYLSPLMVLNAELNANTKVSSNMQKQSQRQVQLIYKKQQNSANYFPQQFQKPAENMFLKKKQSYERPENKMPTLQSSAAHFNYANDYRQNNLNKKKSNQSLAIDDSRQFKFQDFDYSQLQDSSVSSHY